MRKIRPSIIIFVLSLLFLIGCIGLLFQLHTASNQTEKTTVSYTATVQSVEIVRTGEDTYPLIHTQEFSNTLRIPQSVCNQIDLIRISHLQEGSSISFRTEKSWSKQINKTDMIPIVSLQADDTDLLTLDQYNQTFGPSTYPARIMCCILVAIFLAGTVSSLYFVKKGRK